MSEIIDVQGVAESDGEVNKTLPNGTYPGRIESCSWKEIEKEGDYQGAMMLLYSVLLTDPETEISVMANDSIILPCDAMTADQKRRSLAKIKRLQVACGLEEMGNRIDNEAFMYQEIMVETFVKKDKEYGDQNKIKDVLPR